MAFTRVYISNCIRHYGVRNEPAGSGQTGNDLEAVCGATSNEPRHLIDQSAKHRNLPGETTGDLLDTVPGHSHNLVAGALGWIWMAYREILFATLRKGIVFCERKNWIFPVLLAKFRCHSIRARYGSRQRK